MNVCIPKCHIDGQVHHVIKIVPHTTTAIYIFYILSWNCWNSCCTTWYAYVYVHMCVARDWHQVSSLVAIVFCWEWVAHRTWNVLILLGLLDSESPRSALSLLSVVIDCLGCRYILLHLTFYMCSGYWSSNLHVFDTGTPQTEPFYSSDFSRVRLCH